MPKYNNYSPDDCGALIQYGSNDFRSPLGWGSSDNWVDLNIIRFKSGFYIDISVLSLIGMLVSWYFLRYFR